MGNCGGSAAPGWLPGASGLIGGGKINVQYDVWRKPAEMAGSEAKGVNGHPRHQADGSGDGERPAAQMDGNINDLCVCLLIKPGSREGMLMNKRCTNSACRSTFSTLNFDGRCPFCGKAYPQLKSRRKQMISPWKTNVHKNRMPILTENGPLYLKIDLENARKLILEGRVIKGMRALLQDMGEAGYIVGVRDLRELAHDLKVREEYKAVWRVTGESNGHLKMLVREGKESTC